MTDLRTPENVIRDEPVGEDELVAADDAIIGKAFVWSMVVFLAVAGTIGVMVWIMSRPQIQVAAEPRAYVPPQRVSSTVEAPALAFINITKEAGIDFVHVNGATGEKLLPETMGGGCAFLDYDNDGDPDVLFVNSTYWPDDVRTAFATTKPTHALFQNNGKGAFTNVTSGSGLDFTSYGMGVATGDYDNDGHVDVFIASLGPNHLLRNLGNGTFVDMSARANVGGDASAWSTGAGFFDYDNDGWLDLFVCNYVKWSREIDFAVNYTLVGVGRAYGPPTNFEGVHSYLYHNNRDGTFTDVSESAGINVASIQGRPMAKALGVVFCDVDRDGQLDIIVANDTVQNFVFHNQGDGTFKERGSDFGMAFDRNGVATGAMGIDVAHYRNDASIGVVIGNFANEMSSLYVATGDAAQYTDEAITEGIGSPSRSKLTFGAFFFDADLDGRLDLLHANGHIEDQINIVQPSQQYMQPAQLFWNAGPVSRACFVEAPAALLGDMTEPIVGRGATYADIDGDGDLDVVLTQANGPPLLLRNDQHFNHHWIRIKLIGNGRTVNRDAIGASITLKTSNGEQTRTVMPTRSYLSQVEPVLTFGLGSEMKIDALIVKWPDGTAQTLHPGSVDRVFLIQQD